METRLKNRKILWVDDEFQSLRDELRALEFAGAEVTCTGSANGAFEHLLVQQFDLVIIDYRLPPSEPLTVELDQIRADAKLEPDTNQRGALLGLWLKRNKPDTKFFFYTVATVLAEDALRRELDPDGRRFVDKLSRSTYGDNFSVVAIAQLNLGTIVRVAR